LEKNEENLQNTILEMHNKFDKDMEL